MVTIELVVTAATAEALKDDRRREAVARMVERMVTPGPRSLLSEIFERSAAEAAANGLTAEDVDAELAAYNAERRG